MQSCGSWSLFRTRPAQTCLSTNGQDAAVWPVRPDFRRRRKILGRWKSTERVVSDTGLEVETCRLRPCSPEFGARRAHLLLGSIDLNTQIYVELSSQDLPLLSVPAASVLRTRPLSGDRCAPHLSLAIVLGLVAASPNIFKRRSKISEGLYTPWDVLLPILFQYT